MSLDTYIDVFGLQNCFIHHTPDPSLNGCRVIPCISLSSLRRTLLKPPEDIQSYLGIVSDMSMGFSVSGSSLGYHSYGFVYYDPNILAKLAWLQGQPVDVLHKGKYIRLEGSAYSSFPEDSKVEVMAMYRPSRLPDKVPSSPTPSDTFSSRDEMVKTLREMFVRVNAYLGSLPKEEFDKVGFIASLVWDGVPYTGCISGYPDKVGEAFVRLVNNAPLLKD